MVSIRLWLIGGVLITYLTASESFQSHRPMLPNFADKTTTSLRMGKSYLDDLNVFKPAEKRVLVGFSTDAWNIGQRKHKSLLAVHKMAEKIQKMNIACVEVPVFEIAQGPHYDELQRLFESFWIPDFTTTEQLLLQFDLIIVPDPVLAKYLVESYYDKEAKVAKKKQYYDKLIKQPFGVLDAFPPKERYEYERIKNLSKQKWIRKFPPLATCGTDTYDRLKNQAQIEYHADGVEDFALYLPEKMVPNKKVLVLRFKNRFETLVTSLVLKGVDVTSAYPVTWMRKDWSPQEERLAKEVDVVYFHETHAVEEWRNRMMAHNNYGKGIDGLAVAACHDKTVAEAAKAAGFKEIFYAKKSNTEGLIKTVTTAVEHAKKMAYNHAMK